MNELGTRWAVAAHYEGPFEPDQDGYVQFGTAMAPTYWLVTDNEGDEERGRYDTQEKAEARAKRLNREDIERTLDPAFKERRKRLRRLGMPFSVKYGDGPPDLRWPERPGRYAVAEDSNRYGETFWEPYNDRDEVIEAIREGRVWRVVDLDTGKEVHFRIEATVAWPEP